MAVKHLKNRLSIIHCPHPGIFVDSRFRGNDRGDRECRVDGGMTVQIGNDNGNTTGVTEWTLIVAGVIRHH